MCNIVQRICRRVVVEWLIREDGHRLDVCGLKMGKQLVEVWDVEPATGKIGTLMVVLTAEREGGKRRRLTISRSNGGYKIESRTPMGSGESRGEGAAHEWGSARVKAKLREERG
jgi:hypothetical protein